MKEIKLTIPEGCKTVTVKMDGEQVITEFEPKEEKWTPKDGDILYGKSITENIIIYKGTNEHRAVLSYAGIVQFLGVDRLSICQYPHRIWIRNRIHPLCHRRRKATPFRRPCQGRQAMERGEETDRGLAEMEGGGR